MLSLFVTSKAKKRLLRALWRDNVYVDFASAGQLSKRTRVAFASVYRELQALCLYGLVEMKLREDGTETFRARLDHPHYRLLCMFAQAEEMPPELVGDRSVRSQLRTLGAPLYDEPSEVRNPEEALVRGVQLAHRDPTVASVLPLCFVSAPSLLADKLYVLACAHGEKQAVGFFLELTSLLSGDFRFKKLSERYKDKRRKTVRPFFVEVSELDRQVSARNTPALAKKWGWRMNATLDSFKTMFEKHTRVRREASAARRKAQTTNA